jgi:phosphosulfolactate phosphohydrolase-like enzyme
MKIDVLLVPSLIGDGMRNNTLCAVIDVLRATTTISVAAASGAGEIYPCIDTAEVRKYVQLRARSEYLLGGRKIVD